MSSEVNVPTTIGAILAGCMVAVGLSAVSGFQTFLYFAIFPADAIRYKLLVGWIWITDAAHTVLICTAVWQYAILNFSNPGIVEMIFPVVAMTVALTAVTTLSVNAFYIWRIHRLSKSNWWLTGPIALLSIARMALALASTIEMMTTRSFPEFAARFKILFTAGLVLSAVTDILVSVARYYYLRNLKQGYSVTKEVVDAVMVFTINDSLSTCIVVLVVVACWLAMSHNFIYLGVYFTIAKFYSNSTLATLNLRNWYRHRYAWPRPVGIPLTRGSANNVDGAIHVNDRHLSGPVPQHSATNTSETPSTRKRIEANSGDLDQLQSQMEVFVDRQVEYDVAEFMTEDLDVESHLRDGKLANIA